MLRLLRQGGAAQWLMGAVVAAIIVVFMVPAVSGQGGSLAVECVVKVRGSCVSLKDYYAALGLVSAADIPAKQAKALGLPKAVIEGLVERELLVEEAERLGIGVSEEALDKELMAGRIHLSLPVEEHAYLARPTRIGKEMVRYLPVTNSKTGEFDYNVYERVVRNVAGRSASEFREMQRAEVTANRVRALVRGRVRVSADEVWAQYKREKARATARTVSVNKPWFGRYAVDTSDKALDAWLKDNSAKVDEKWGAAKAEWTSGCPLVREIAVMFPPDATDEDKALKRTELDTTLASLKQPGANFADVAREQSEGPSAPVGGMLGCFTEKYGPGAKELLATLEAMKPGEISPVLETPRSFVVLKLEKRLAEAEVEKVGRRELGRALMAVDRAESLAKEFADKLLAAAKGGEALGEAADRLAREYASQGKPLKAGVEPKGMDDADRPKLNVTPAFAMGSRPLQNTMEDVAAHAFALDKPDAIHPNLIITLSGFAVLQLKEKTEATREELEKERFEYTARLREAKEQEALRTYIKALKQSAEGLITRNEALVISDKDKAKDEG